MPSPRRPAAASADSASSNHSVGISEIKKSLQQLKKDVQTLLTDQKDSKEHFRQWKRDCKTNHSETPEMSWTTLSEGWARWRARVLSIYFCIVSFQQFCCNLCVLQQRRRLRGPARRPRRVARLEAPQVWTPARRPPDVWHRFVRLLCNRRLPDTW